jgi:hypothetical protein
MNLRVGAERFKTHAAYTTDPITRFTVRAPAASKPNLSRAQSMLQPLAGQSSTIERVLALGLSLSTASSASSASPLKCHP